jgi:DNA-binding Xre family transcriptional regulator
MNLLKVKKILGEKQLTINWLSKQIGMSNQNLYKCFEKNRIEANDLERIAQVLDVNVSYFFDDTVPYTGHKIKNSIGNNFLGNINGNGVRVNLNPTDNEKEIDHLKEIIREKDNTIEAMKELIVVLKEREK